MNNKEEGQWAKHSHQNIVEQAKFVCVTFEHKVGFLSLGDLRKPKSWKVHYIQINIEFLVKIDMGTLLENDVYPSSSLLNQANI